MFSNVESEDQLIRAYSRCPTYQDILEAWFQSDEFKSKEAETAAFR